MDCEEFGEEVLRDGFEFVMRERKGEGEVERVYEEVEQTSKSARRRGRGGRKGRVQWGKNRRARQERTGRSPYDLTYLLSLTPAFNLACSMSILLRNRTMFFPDPS